jgi:prophage regulatory protein
MTEQPPDRILRLNAVLDRTGLTRATLYRKIQAGTFPKQVRIATRCTGWRNPPSVNGCAIPCSMRQATLPDARVATADRRQAGR